MKEKADIYEWIESYLTGKLDGEDLVEFEAQLKSDPDFANQVQLHKELADSLGDPMRAKLSGILTNLGEEFTQEEPAKSRPLWLRPRFQAIAAAIAILFTVGIVISQWLSKPNPKKLFETYYESYPAQGRLRSPNPTLDSLWNSGIASYKAQEFDVAILSFEEVLKTEQNNSSASFFLGLSLLEKKRTGEAANALEKVITDETSLFRDQASWYRALIHLNNNETEKATDILTTLSVKSGKYGNLAKKLLKEL